ncbi:hypothetical protein VC33_13855 [Pseudomonas fluorescens]|nr:hypothetical protein VC33_13855 [Pseudomonas fluorescens]OOG15006.1 hypothetical protein BMS17_23910 [Pseudomonas sp. C9]
MTFEITSRDANSLFPIKKLQQDHDALGAERGNEDAFKWRQRPSNDLQVFAGFQVVVGVRFR